MRFCFPLHVLSLLSLPFEIETNLKISLSLFIPKKGVSSRFQSTQKTSDELEAAKIRLDGLSNVTEIEHLIDTIDLIWGCLLCFLLNIL